MHLETDDGLPRLAFGGYHPARLPRHVPDAPDPAKYAIHRSEVRNGVTIAYVREGVGGIPLLLLHGYPETKRIWWRNIGPLADAGFEVIAPDFRGHGDSSLAPDNFYDIAARLDRLLHARARRARPPPLAVAGGDVGGVVLFDIGLRYPDFVTRQVLFNTVPPPLQAVYDAAGLPPEQLRAQATGHSRLLHPPGDRTRGVARRARYSGSPSGIGRTDVRPPVVGHAERVVGRGSRVPQ